MPRDTAQISESAPSLYLPAGTASEKLNQLLEQLRGSEGWDVEDRGNSWEIIGGTGLPLNVPKNVSSQNLNSLLAVLDGEGWKPQNAVAAPARPQSADASASVPDAVPQQQAPTDKTRAELHHLLNLVRRTPGWRCEPDGSGWRITGGANVITIPSGHLSLEDVEGLEKTLAQEGWSRSGAEEHIAHVDEIYAQAYAEVPRGGYPHIDLVITRADAQREVAKVKECGCNSRPPRRRRIDQYAEAMKRGEWRPFSPQGLVRSAEHECVLDGTQRLMALIQSGLPQMGFRVTYKVPIAEFPFLDQGASRTIADVLVAKGIPKSAGGTIGAAVKLAMGYDSGLPWKRWHALNPTAPQISRALDEGGEYAAMGREAYNDALILGWNPKELIGCKMSPTVACVLSFLIRRDYPDGPWEEFRSALVYGANLPYGDARLAFREQMTGRPSGVRRRYEMYLQLGGALQAWEHWLNDVPTTLHIFKDNQAIPKVWCPGMPMSGSDPERMAREKRDRFARLIAKNGQAAPAKPEQG